MQANDMKIKILEDILEHLSGMQSADLKDELDRSKKPADEALEEAKEGDDVEAAPGEPKAEDAMALAPGEEEMSDDELQELLKEHLKG